MSDMDQGIKRLLQIAPGDILRLALPGAEYVGTMPTEVATEAQLSLDTLFRIRYQGIECAVNVEAQAQGDPDIPRRCFAYASRAMFLHNLPVFSVVLWLQKKGKIPSPPYKIRVGDRLLGTWDYINIPIFDLVAHDMITLGEVGLLPLVPFMRGADVATIEAAAQIVKDRASDAAVQSLEILIAIFAARFHGKDFARDLYRRLFMSTEILDESPLYREWVETAEAKGKLIGMRNTVRGVLEGRFATLPDDVIATLQAADETTLNIIIMHITTDTLEQVRARLGLAV